MESDTEQGIIHDVGEEKRRSLERLGIDMVISGNYHEAVKFYLRLVKGEMGPEEFQRRKFYMNMSQGILDYLGTDANMLGARGLLLGRLLEIDFPDQELRDLLENEYENNKRGTIAAPNPIKRDYMANIVKTMDRILSGKDATVESLDKKMLGEDDYHVIQINLRNISRFKRLKTVGRRIGIGDGFYKDGELESIRNFETMLVRANGRYFSQYSKG